MESPARVSRARDRLLFTPGPLSTSTTVKQAMLRDVGSWDAEFSGIIREIRHKLLAVAGVGKDIGYEAILMQGSGSFGLEAVVTSVVPKQGKLLVLVNGAYGERIATMAARQAIPCSVVRCAESESPSAEAVRAALAGDTNITHVMMVHCETTSGILNPLEDIAAVVREFGKQFVVDAMSSFGAIPINLPGLGIDLLISSANKCVEGVPGFSFVIARRAALEACEGRARSWCLDLFDQWRYMEQTGLFRATPPTHVVLAFQQALVELADEGGVAARGARYRTNQAHLVAGMRALGFREFLPAERQSPIITTFLCPAHPEFDFQTFYDRLHARGHIIYPGKVTSAACFRIGNIGRLFTADIDDLLGAIGHTLREMNAVLNA